MDKIENMRNVTETDLARNISKRANSLIYANYNLNALAQDILQIIIAQIKDEDQVLKSYKFGIRELENKLSEGSDYTRRITMSNIKKARKELKGADIIFKDNVGTEVCYSWCTKFSINETQKWIAIELHEELNSYLIDVVNQGRFTMVENEFFMPLKSSYSKRLYMILRNKLDMAAENNLSHGEYEVTIETLATRLMIPNSVSFNFYNLKRRVLEVAMKQINEHTDITIGYHPVKKGNKHYKIVFLVKNKIEVESKKEEEVLEAEYEVVENKSAA